jgi:hypothetical protein
MTSVIPVPVLKAACSAAKASVESEVTQPFAVEIPVDPAIRADALRMWEVNLTAMGKQCDWPHASQLTRLLVHVSLLRNGHFVAQVAPSAIE